MKLIENFVEKFNNYSLPTPEQCFVFRRRRWTIYKCIDNKWIKNEKINVKIKNIYEWIEKKYLSNKKQLKKTDKKSLMN